MIGEPGAGKSSMLFYLCNQWAHAGYFTVVIAPADTVHSGIPDGCLEALDLEDALAMAGDTSPLLIGYDEIALEIENGKPSIELRAVGRYRRHLRANLFFTTQRLHDLPPAIRDLDIQWRFLRMSDRTSWEYKWIERSFPHVASELPGLESYWWDGPSDPGPILGTHYVIGR